MFNQRPVLSKAIVYLIPISAWGRLVPRNGIVFNYHVVADEKLPHVQNLFRYKNRVAFEEDLRYLRKRFAIVNYQEFMANQDKPRRQKSPLALLTFDDGLAQCYQIVCPVLSRFKTAVVFFISTGLVCNREMFFRHKISICVEKILAYSWDDIPGRGKLEALFNEKVEDREGAIRLLMRISEKEKRLADELCDALEVDWKDYLRTQKPYLDAEQIKSLSLLGHTIGAHTIDHSDLEVLSEREIEHQIVDSCVAVAEMSGAKKVPFAFPYGRAERIKDVALRIARRNPVVGPMFVGGGVKQHPPFISRIAADEQEKDTWGSEDLEKKLQRAYGRYVRAKLFKEKELRIL